MYEVKPEDASHVLLMYSGGLDTSAILLWLQEKGARVSTLTVDLGQGEDLKKVKEKAIELGAHRAFIIDAKREFVEDYVTPSIKANGLYMGIYPLFTALSRPLISEKAVKLAKRIRAEAIAHGSTGKGNDQVRLELNTLVLNPDMKIVAPVRTFKLSRAEELNLLKGCGLDISSWAHKDYSIDENLWGISFQGSEISSPSNQVSSKVFDHAKEYFPEFNPPESAPDKPEVIEIGFRNGVPTSLNGQKLDLGGIINQLNALGAKHGVGIIDYVEDYIFGHKGREFYIAPAAEIIITAHKDLEHLLLPKKLLHEKQQMDSKWSYMVYHGWWYHKFKCILQESIEKMNENIAGSVTLKLYKGKVSVLSRESPNTPKLLYSEKLGAAGFDELASPGFIELSSLEMVL